MACLSLSSALLFSPAAFENWLWGIQWVIFVPLLCVLIAFLMQDRTQSFILRFGITVFLNVVAMFSFSNGIIVWCISFPFWRECIRWVAGRRGSKGGTTRLLIWSLLYLLTAVVFVRIYFMDTENMPEHPSLTHALKAPVSLLKYLAAWCGGPFHSGVIFRVTLGVFFICLVSLVFLRAAYRARKHPGWKTVFYLRKLYPSLLIIAYAFASGAITAIGRAEFGVQQAFSSRYLFHSGALLVGLISAFNTHRIITMRLHLSTSSHSVAFRNVVVAFLIFFLRNWHHYYPWFEITRLARVQALLTVRMLAIEPNNPLVGKISLWTDLPTLVKALNSKNIYKAPIIGDWIFNELTHPQPERGGIFQTFRRGPSELGFIGGAMIPARGSPADAVLVCRKGEADHFEPWIMLAVGFKNSDLIEIDLKALPSKSGFKEYISWDWTIGSPSVEAFAVDEQNRKLYPISRIP